MAGHASPAPGHAAHGRAHASHGTRRSYVTGFVLSALLTAVPFWLVMSGAVPSLVVTALLIFGMGLVQIGVQASYFLHLDTKGEGGWTMIAFAFTVAVVAITIGGSIWIMYHLDLNMMPPPPR